MQNSRQQNNRHTQTRSDDTSSRIAESKKNNVPPVIWQDAMIDNITGIIRTRKRKISITPLTSGAGSADFTITTQIRVITIQNYSAANVMNIDTKQNTVTLSITKVLATKCVPMNTMIKFFRLMKRETMNLVKIVMIIMFTIKQF